MIRPILSAPRTILVADPMEAVRQLVTMLLQGQGYATLEAADGVTALNYLKEGRADLALLDVLLPKLSGIEVLCEAATLPNRVPVLLFTGLGCLTSASEASLMGAFDYLLKPVRNQDLLDSIERALDENGGRVLDENGLPVLKGKLGRMLNQN